MDAAIEPLPEVTRTKLRSTQILTSLSQIVSELLQNSLDAGAHQIDVGVDCEEWTCWVRDDGSGMSKDGMDILGKGLEAGRYGALALASCADICCLEISSRTARSRQSWSVIVKGSETLYDGPAVRWRRESPGTTVCIRDAFYNATSCPPSFTSNPSATLDAIRHEIEAFALVFPNVGFTLENTHSIKDEKDMLLRIPKTTSMLAAFRHLYGRALAQHVEEIDVTSGELRLKGFISLDGAYSKVHINRHPISLCELHHIIDSRFASSSFAKHAFDEAGETSLRSTTRRSPRKTEKRPVYVLDLSVPPQQMDNCLEPAKAAVHLRNKNAVMSLLGSITQAFLIRHGFSAENKPNQFAQRRKYDFEDDSGYAEPGPSRQDLSRDASPTPLYTCEETEELVWTDPHTGQIYVVDARTGNSYRQSEPPAVDADGQKVRGSGSLDKSAMPEWIQKALEANDIYTVPENKIPSLTHFPLRIPTPPCRHTSTTATGSRPGQPYGDSTSASSRRFQKDDLRNAQSSIKWIASLLPATLILIDQHAADERVRVERFLKELCLGYLSNVNARGDRNNFLRLRDLTPPVPILLSWQEEQQLRNLSTGRVFEHWGFNFVEPSAETSYKTEQGLDAGSTSGYSQVFVRCVPEVVADKLLLDDELKDFVKAFLAKLQSDPPRTETDEAGNDETDEFHWLRALRWCPQQLLDLVNSKACRGAKHAYGGDILDH
ncbi:hypothetical protein B0H13DRAFT_1963442 [Mycena leptocephala]|nr:hypothetical protein B0H13DRAFT_1963442 [Mycena leptocephala]